MKRIFNFKIIGDFKVEFVYENDEKIVVDFQEKIKKGGIFDPLRNKEFFNKIKVAETGRFVYWPDEIELCADSLWLEAREESFVPDSKEAS